MDPVQPALSLPAHQPQQNIGLPLLLVVSLSQPARALRPILAEQPSPLQSECIWMPQEMAQPRSLSQYWTLLDKEGDGHSEKIGEHSKEYGFNDWGQPATGDIDKVRVTSGNNRTL